MNLTESETRTLRVYSRGPQRAPWGVFDTAKLRRLGLVDFDPKVGEIGCFVITDAGRAALAAHEKGGAK